MKIIANLLSLCDLISSSNRILDRLESVVTLLFIMMDSSSNFLLIVNYYST